VSAPENDPAADVLDVWLDEMEQIEPRSEKPARGRRRRGISKLSRELREFITDVLVPAYERMTVRQAFYQCASIAQLVPKTDEADKANGVPNGYRQVQRQVLAMRECDELSWGFITDGTRWQRKPSTWDSADDYLDSVLRGYRRNLWQSQKLRIEVWLEKDALADVIVDTTSKWDVALMVSRGQSSATYLHNSADAAREMWDRHGVQTVIFTLYDHDPGGCLRAHPTIVRDLPRYAGPDVPIQVIKLAVTPAQITAWNLPTRPRKKKDSQAKEWGGRPNVELDAIDPARLNALVDGAISGLIDERAWKIEQAMEVEEREGFQALRAVWDEQRDAKSD
jgi:hypothetical protein